MSDEANTKPTVVITTQTTSTSQHTFALKRGKGPTRSLPPGYNTSVALRRRGRPFEWTKESLERAILEAATATYVENKYRRPNLSQVVARINTKRRPMNEESLRKLMQRHGLKWSELKKLIPVLSKQ